MRLPLSRAIPALLLGVFAVSAPVHAAAPDRLPLRSYQPPYFNADVAVTMDSTAAPAVRVTVSVPYPELNWRQVPEGGYTAGAAIVVELQRRGRPLRLRGDSWEQRLRVADYATTVSNRNQVVTVREFPVPPGDYSVRVTVRDVRGREPSEVRDRITVRDLSSLPVGFADLELGLVDSAGAFVPFPGRQFGYNVAALAVRSSLVDRRPGVWPRVHRYRWRVVDESGNRIATGDTAVTSPRALVPAVLRPALPPLFLGEYSFELELQEGRDTWRTSRVFEVEESGPPQGRDFDLLCEALLYIAEASEVDALRLLPASDRGAGWDAFWRRRDPTPETARNEYQIEFFRRLHVAEQRFQGFGPGWRSDMGRIYIRYGPPDQVEQRAGTSTQPALEIWYYNQPYRRLVFADREGFGRYVLMNSPGE